MDKDVFGFDDSAYFGKPMSQMEMIRDRLEEEHENVILTGGPGWVSLDKEKMFPVLALRVTESPIAHSRPFKEYAVIAAWDASSGRLYAELFVEQKFIKIKRDPSIVPPPGKYSDGGALDLFARNIVPVIEGDFYNTVIVQGSKSNRFRTLVGKSEFKKDRIGFESILRERHSKNESTLGVVKDLIPEASAAGTGLLPNSIVLSIVSGKGGNGVLHDAALHIDYALPHGKFPESILRQSKTDRSDPIFFGLLATGSSIPSPLVWRVAYSPSSVKVSEDGQVRGGINIFLDQLKGMEPGQTYYFYAFSGSEMSEAAVFDYVLQAKK